MDMRTKWRITSTSLTSGTPSRSSSLQKLLRDNLADRLLIDVKRRQTIADAAGLRALEDQSLVRVDVSGDFCDVGLS